MERGKLYRVKHIAWEQYLANKQLGTPPSVASAEIFERRRFRTIEPLPPTFVSPVRMRRQRNANEFLVVSGINILMGKSRDSPGELSTAKQ